jgi:hypothetical protein
MMQRKLLVSVGMRCLLVKEGICLTNIKLIENNGRLSLQQVFRAQPY